LLNKYKYKIPKIWLYEIKGVQDVASIKELEIARKLPNMRAKVFLESRAYLRQSLAALFELNPLEIALIANPGEPPLLPKGMGNISLSHCKDAMIVAWHEKRIGIDIERIDRNFNYEKLAKKYFTKTNKFIKNGSLNKKMILNQWCALEAAIKWNNGKLAKEIREWEYFESKKKLIHKKKKLDLRCAQINFYQWNISIAFEHKPISTPIMICSSKNF
tara:strand:+ start:898 stop:1548 length:651 start_codon:yes stop_codon:yes gene_type:complete